jgi:Ca2+-binding RTX toxin-like protein
LSVTTAIAAAIAANQDNLTSIETLTISDASGAVDMRYFPTVTRLNLTGKTAAATTVTVNSGTTVALTADAGDQAHTFTVLGTGTTDTMTLILSSGVDLLGTTGTSDFFTGIETLNIQTQSTIAGTVNIFAGATVMTATASTETINISGKTAITFTGAVTADAINGSGLVGSSAILTLTGGTASAAVITGGEAADVLLGSSAADIISGGGGADTITTSGGTDTLTGGAGADIFYAAAAAHVGNVITDFTAGTGGDIFRIDDSGFGDLTGANTLAFKAISAGITAAAATDNVLVVQTAVAGTSAAAVEDAVNLAGGGVGNFSTTDVMYVIYNSSTGKAEVWNDLDGDTDDNGTGVTLTATFDNITTLVGVQALVAGNFNVVA